MKTFIITIALITALFCSPVRSFSQLSESESMGIIYISGDEKAAYDFYTIMSDKYKSAVFNNISQSEKTHMDKMSELAARFGINESELGFNNGAGIFSNKKHQSLYDEMILMGGYSVLDAYRAAARFEETDINDLRENLSKTSNEAIISTYQYLDEASQNHLRAFVRNMKKEGMNYKPFILSQDDFDKIMSVKSKTDNSSN